ncbi:hypothetical protein H6G06_20940 [Anabaena sphaerica FACHB-251]|uniref:Uncharacterized protein n=1 Tax=Anabaena sphaerica FACHB-251 TaxID=2692883 RepID=A0A926WK35_9NOST|nr:hypothetical protein [Anabaena sphaerica]MBD2295872.1 hypothetical protein [Anabaena sphaerica FACHB-251]
MTTVVCWLNKSEEEHRLWSIADTQISRKDRDVLGKQIVYTELLKYGAKIFPLYIKCKTDFFSPNPYFEHSIGMAYAGASLIGLNIYATLANILQNLNNCNKEIPSISDVANCVKNLLELMAISVGASGSDATCEIAIFGFCYPSYQFKIFHLETDISSGKLEIKVTEGDISNDNYFLLLGSKKDEIRTFIYQKRTEYEKTHLEWWYAPEKVIKEIVSEKKFNGIGGSVQRGISTKSGFQLYSYVVPLNKGDSQAGILYQNIDIFQEIGLVGNCIIGIPGLS